MGSDEIVGAPLDIQELVEEKLELPVSVIARESKGGRYWTCTSDLLGVKLKLENRAKPTELTALLVLSINQYPVVDNFSGTLYNYRLKRRGGQDG